MTPSWVLTRLVTGTPAATPGASPEPAEVVNTPPPQLVTPGTIGFLVTFGVAVALVFLVRDMNRRVRRIRVRAERADEQLRAAEARASDQQGASPIDSGSPERAAGPPEEAENGRPAPDR